MELSKSNNKNQLSDLELVNGYKSSGDNSYMAVLYQRYLHLMYGVCMKYLKDQDESKDAVQQIFEKLLLDINRHEISHFKSWLHTVTKNHCLMHLRSEKSTFDKKEELKKDFPIVMEKDFVLHQDSETNTENELKNLEIGITELNEKQKICIELFYLQEKSYVEVAEMTGYSLNEVKSFIQNGKRNLKNYILSKNGQ